MPTEAEESPADTVSFPLSPGERVLVNTIPTARPPGMWAAFNAVRHLSRAWIVRELDPAMAVFRSITAEEESASAVFRAVKRVGYPGSKHLRPRDHLHKNALFPFCAAVYRTIADVSADPVATETYFDTSTTPPRLRVRVRVPLPGEDQVLCAEPTESLHFSVSESDADGIDHPVDFGRQLLALARANKLGSVVEYLRDRANARNRLLYAADAGYPSISGDTEQELVHYQKRTFANLTLFLAIDQYPSRQSFVQQALEAFLAFLPKIPRDIVFE